ncbi:MAG: cadherin repeat domain-containing protein [Planctomycetaceae bacterium]
MQQREKILAGVLGAFVVLWLFAPKFDSAFLAPLREARENIDAAKTRLIAAEDKEVETIQAKGFLAAKRRRSLPRDPNVAMRVYQEWLTDLAEVSGWQRVEIDPGRTSENAGNYTTIPVTLKARVTWEQLGRFTTLFQEADLLQRFKQFDVLSRNAGGGGPVDVTLTVEGLAMVTGPETSQISPESRLAAGLDVSGTTLKIDSIEGFPNETPFLLRIGPEMVRVTECNGTSWTIERGARKSSPRTFDAGEVVQLFPTMDPPATAAPALEQFVSTEFFAKPRPTRTYSPKLSTPTPQQAYFNKFWSYAVSVSDWNPDWDEPVYTLRGDFPEGMEINPATGDIQWTPAPADEPQTYKLEVAVMSIWADEPKLTGTVTVSAMRQNLPPVLNVPGEVPVYFGRSAEISFAAENPEGENDRHSYRLDGQLPQGATFDSASGTLRWDAPLDGVPGTVSLQLTATDNGSPAESTTRSINLVLGDDVATYTRFEGVFGINGQQVAFFRDLTQNKQRRAGVGDKVTAAGVGGTVEEIGLNFVVLTDEDKRWRLEPGQNLRQLQELPPKPIVPDTSADEPPTVPKPEAIEQEASS